jgi:gliding motility-associated-like protein
MRLLLPQGLNIHIKPFFTFMIFLAIVFAGTNKSHAQFCLAASPYPAFDPCYLTVIANDPFCCTTFWDGLCQSAYDACNPGGGGCSAVAPYPASDACYQIVIANDPFCCNNTWDAACQTAYDGCGPIGPIVVSTNTYTPQQLVTDVLLGACVEAFNITYVGAATARGSFTNGNTLGFGSGIILSSGNVVDAQGPYTGFISSTAHGTPGDPDLQAIAGVATFDAAIIEFDFVATSNQINFEYVFASDEYADYTCSNVNDAFGFFITGPGYAPGTNVALVPGGTIPVSINTVNQGFPSGFNSAQNCLDLDPNYAANSIYYNNNAGGQEISYGGYTDVFVAELNLIPCETYHIKLAIADGGDSGFDSSVFLKAGSFSAGLEVNVVAGTVDQTQDAIEGCQNGFFMFVNQGNPVTEPTDYTFTIGGTAEMGVDYATIPNTITFLPGQDTVYITIEAFLDGIAEGIETIELYPPTECTCLPPDPIILNIIDNDVLSASISDDVIICTGSSTTLQLTGGGSLAAPYTYSWSSGQSTSQITVSPIATTTYTGTVTDACGTQSIDLSVTVTVSNQIVVDLDGEICTGGQFTMPDGSTANSAGLYTFNFVTAQNCDSVVNVTLTLIDGYTQTSNVIICQGEEYTLPNGNIVDESGTYNVMLQSVSGCDSLITTIIAVSPPLSSTQFASICTGDTFTLPNGNSVGAAGNYTVTLTSSTGCDSLVTTTLATTPVYGIAQAEVICNNQSVTLPDGSQTNTAGNYTFNFSTVLGCDSVINVNVSVGSQEINTQSVTICQGSNYTLPDGTAVNTTGYYEVVTDNGSCGVLNQITVAVNPSYSSTIQAQICSGQNYTLPNGNIVTQAGTYNVTLQTTNGCDSLITTVLAVSPPITSTQIASICAGQNYTLPNGNVVTVAGNYTSNLTTAGGCDSIVQVQLSVIPVSQSTSTVHLCQGESHILPDGSSTNLSGGYNFTFMGANGCDSIITVNVFVHPTYNTNINVVACDNQTVIDPDGNPINQSGNYTLIYTTIWGCDSIVNLNITVYPTYSETVEISFCSGDQFVTQGGQVISQSGTFYDFFQTANSCDSTIQYNVSVISGPLALIDVSPDYAGIYEPYATFTSFSFGADSLSWNCFDFGTFSDSIITIQFSDISGFYPICLTVWNEYGCQNQYCMEYEVREDFAIYIPNAFSPNGDGVNDLFSIEGSDINPDDFLLQIFNRWGELIFESRSPSNKWNGVYRGSSSYLAQEEVYVYRAVIGSLATKKKKELNGTVTVIR